jgi:hypothetical protein
MISVIDTPFRVDEDSELLIGPTANQLASPADEVWRRTTDFWHPPSAWTRLSRRRCYCLNLGNR